MKMARGSPTTGYTCEAPNLHDRIEHVHNDDVE